MQALLVHSNSSGRPPSVAERRNESSTTFLKRGDSSDSSGAKSFGVSGSKRELFTLHLDRRHIRFSRIKTSREV
jgi:hypothetical protein